MGQSGRVLADARFRCRRAIRGTGRTHERGLALDHGTDNEDSDDPGYEQESKRARGDER